MAHPTDCVFNKMLDYPPIDLHWFFEISITTEKIFQLELKKKIQLVYTENKISVRTEIL